MGGPAIVLLIFSASLAAAATTKSPELKKDKIDTETSRPYIVGQSRLYEHVGFDVTFECAHASDAVKLTWWFDGELIATSGTLALKNITRDQAGTYTCRAVDPASRRSYSTAASLRIPDPQCVSHFIHAEPGNERYYRARWWPESNDVVFDIEAAAVAAKHWIGVGFSRNGSLPFSDLIVGWVERQGRFRIQDRHVGALESQLVLDTNQTGLSLIYGRTVGGVTRLQFRRRADLRDDTHDAVLNDCHFFFYLWRGTVLSVAKIRPHRHALRSEKRICPRRCPAARNETQVRQLAISRPFVQTSASVNESVSLPFLVSGIDGCARLTLKRNEIELFTATFEAEKTFRSDRFVVSCTGSVSIEETACSDSGTYSLVASFGEMTATAFIALDVCLATEIVSRSQVTAKNRLRATLSLNSAGKIFLFKKDGRFLLPSNRITVQERSIKISPVYRFDSGTYTICFTNPNPTNSSKCSHTCEEAELTVQEFPKVHIYTPRHFIDAGRHLHCSIKCHVAGSPTPIVTWMRNGRVFQPEWTTGFFWEKSNGRLLVPCWNVEHSARYTCMAHSDVGTDSKSVMVTVMEETETSGDGGEKEEEEEEALPTKPTLYQVLRRNPVYHRIQSEHFSYRVMLNVRNRNPNPVDILWIDYEGNAVAIKTVQPNTLYTMFSYRTHPLVAMDAITKQWLTMNGRFPFFPNPVWMEDVAVCNPYANASSDSRYTGIKLRSPGLFKQVYIWLYNRYSRPIDLMWIHMNGSMMILEKTVESDDKVSYRSYEGDLWMARDSRTGRNLLINDSLVFPMPSRNASMINITEPESCDEAPIQENHLRDSFFVFGCRGIHVIDAFHARVTNFVSHNTSIRVDRANQPMCRQTTLADPSTHAYEKSSSTHEWIGKTRSNQGKILEELLITGSWSSARHPSPCPRCDVCRWGQPVRACAKFIYVPEAATRRVYVIDVASEEIVDAIQLVSIPYKVQFVAGREEIWIHAYDTPTLSVVKSACHDDAKIVMEAEERPNKVMGYNVVTFGNGIRGRSDIGLVTSPHDSKIAEFNLDDLKFGSLVFDASSYGCLNTFGMAYSPLNAHAFVSCFRHGGYCSLLEIDTLTMRVVGQTSMRACGYSYVSPDGHFVVTIPQPNPDIVTDPDVLVQKVSPVNGGTATSLCSVPVNETVGHFFASRPGFLARGASSWDVFFTFKTADVVLKLSLSDSCEEIRVLERFGKTACPAGEASPFSVAGPYARFIDTENAFAGRYLGTPARHENQFVIWDEQEEKVEWVGGEEMELPYYVVATGPPH